MVGGQKSGLYHISDLAVVTDVTWMAHYIDRFLQVGYDFGGLARNK